MRSASTTMTRELRPQRRVRHLLTPVVLSLAVLLAACGSDTANTAGAPDEGTERPQLARVISFDPAAGENPAGIAPLEDGNLLVSFPFLRQLWIYNPTSGEVVSVQEDVPSFAFMSRLDDGRILLSAIAFLDPAFDQSDPGAESNAGPLSNHGLWVYDPPTQALTQLAVLPPTSIPAHHVVLLDGRILVSDTVGGKIWAVNPQTGASEVWLTDPLFAGDPAVPGPEGRPPIPTGIEGLELVDDAVYGVVADAGRIVRIPLVDGSEPGTPELAFEAPVELFGIADFIFDAEGDMVAVSGFQSEVWHIAAATDFAITVLGDNSSDVVVDTPSSIVRGLGPSAGAVFYTNLALIVNDAKAPPSPGLSQVTGVNE